MIARRGSASSGQLWRAWLLAAACALPASAQEQAEVRGTWLTTTANHALRSPADTADTMRRLRGIGLNTVYVESWKDGYTQFPSSVLERTVGIRQHRARDLVQETLIEAHRNGLIYVSWFEYGFMAAHKDTLNHLRRQKPEWLSRDRHGSELAPNGFVWLNPLHPQARRFLLDLVLEAVERYDLDGVQLDDRIVWPHVTMGYDDYTSHVYAQEHQGKLPPQDHKDPAWMRWRAAKVTEFARQFVDEIRARRPGLLVSLSPAVHPWAWDNYLLDWPEWSAKAAPRWDEFIPQAYRHSFAAFEKTWRQQVEAMRSSGGNRQDALLAGIRITGDGPDSSWDQLRRSIELTRTLGSGGHVLWFSRGVLDLYGSELTDFYRASGPAFSRHFGPGWRQRAIELKPVGRAEGGRQRWQVPAHPGGTYRLIAHDGSHWRYLDDVRPARRGVRFPQKFKQVEMVLDRRAELNAGCVPGWGHGCPSVPSLPGQR